MYLTKLTLDPRHPGARRDLADAYEMHRTLARAFVSDESTPPARFLWRLEPPRRGAEPSEVLVQSGMPGRWTAIESLEGYASKVEPNKPVDLEAFVRKGSTYRFRLIANPTVTRDGKRFGLPGDEEQLAWLSRQATQHGFVVLEAIRLGSAKLGAGSGSGRPGLTLQSVRFEGQLSIQDPGKVSAALTGGIGHGKAFGLGMLSLAPVRRLAPTPPRHEENRP